MNILEEIYKIHDVGCNQKYDKYLPYSFHLKAVVAQARKYIKSVPLRTFETEAERQICSDPVHVFVIIAAAGHDLIEDARLTYNDVISLTRYKGVQILFMLAQKKKEKIEQKDILKNSLMN